MKYIKYNVDGNTVYTPIFSLDSIIFDNHNDSVCIRTLGGGYASCDNNMFRFVEDESIVALRNKMIEG